MNGKELLTIEQIQNATRAIDMLSLYGKEDLCHDLRYDLEKSIAGEKLDATKVKNNMMALMDCTSHEDDILNNLIAVILDAFVSLQVMMI